jgi:hypothetical protein
VIPASDLSSSLFLISYDFSFMMGFRPHPDGRGGKMKESKEEFFL